MRVSIGLLCLLAWLGVVSSIRDGRGRAGVLKALRRHAMPTSTGNDDTVAVINSGQNPKQPSWPSSYMVKYVFTLPYTAKVQPEAISYDVVLYRQGDEEQEGSTADSHGIPDSSDERRTERNREKSKGPRVRMEVRNGSNVMIATPEKQYQLEPRLDRQVCRVFEDLEPGDSMVDLNALPDISGWVFQGVVPLENHADAVVWQYERRHEAKTVQYRFFVGNNGIPLKLHMLGNDLLSGAHYDEWIIEFTDFIPGRPDDALFEKPSQVCESVVPGFFAEGYEDQETSVILKDANIHPGLVRMRSLVPHVEYSGDAQYDAFLAEHAPNRRHSSLNDYNRRREIFIENLQMIELHNQKDDRTFTMAMNRFGDWSKEERRAILLPRRIQSKTNSRETQSSLHFRNKEAARHEIPYEPLTDPSKLPSEIDWRGTGAEGRGVLDQANCGSCWAFGAVGAMVRLEIISFCLHTKV